MSTTDDEYFVALLEDDPAKLYDRAPCGYLTTSGDGTIRKVNRTLVAMTGYEVDELVGRRRFAELLTVGGRIYHETHFAPMLHVAGTAREIALDLRHRDGHPVPVLVNAVAERGRDDAVALIRVAVFDATYRRRYEQELLRAKHSAEASEARARALARTLQQTLIPPVPPVIPQLDVAGAYRPAGDGTEVGGDFYDVFRVGGGDWVVVIGDVCGKGAEAAVVTALTRYTLRAAAMDHPSPAEALRRLNEVMVQSGTDRFCTVAMVRLRKDDRDGRRWTGVVGTAGHPPPILRRADGTLSSVGQPGMLMGVVAHPEVTDVALGIEPGDTLVMYTDGLPEARRGTEFYGDDRVRAIVARPHPAAADLADALLRDVLEFQRGVARDDVAIVVVRGE